VEAIVSLFGRLVEGRIPGDAGLIEKRAQVITRVAILIGVLVNLSLILGVFMYASAWPAVVWLIVSSVWYLSCLLWMRRGWVNWGRSAFSMGTIITVTVLVILFGNKSSFDLLFFDIAAGSALIWPGRRALSGSLVGICCFLFIFLGRVFPVGQLVGLADRIVFLSPANQIVSVLTILLVVISYDKTSFDLEAQLLRREEGHRVFVSSVSHEIRNSLSILSGYLRRASKLVVDSSSRQAEALGHASDEVVRLERVLVSLIQISRAEMGVLHLSTEGTELVALVQNCCEQASRRHGREVVGVLQSGMAEVWALADAKQLNLILDNLIENAVKYSDRNLPVVLDITACDDCAAIDIRDQGVGIPPHEQAMIFERFYRASNVREAVDGTGLGLALDRLLARAMNGDVVLASSRPGETVMQVRLQRSSSTH
jgi:signal transduction histidine kinase